jgi:hypothetical protein
MPNAETVVGVRRERHRAHEKVAGEPVARKAGTAGSGRGPLEKDLNRHLAGGLPVLRPIMNLSWLVHGRAPRLENRVPPVPGP